MTDKMVGMKATEIAECLRTAREHVPDLPEIFYEFCDVLAARVGARGDLEIPALGFMVAYTKLEHTFWGLILFSCW